MLNDTSYYANTEPCGKTKPLHPLYEFENFANPFASYSMTKLSNSASQLMN